MNIQHPYLLFLGDATDPLAVKTSRGIAQWRPEKCLGENTLPGCEISLGLTNLSIEEAVEKGAKTFVVGLANRGGKISQSWLTTILKALEHGLDVASGLHQRLADIPEIHEKAKALGRQLFDVRHATGDFTVGTGEQRTGNRILTVGSDCSVGKMYTSLALEGELASRGVDVSFCATGQTGILISGSGISIDAVVADFISGVVEDLAPSKAANHWHVIEGQGSLFHPSYAGVSLGLLHGAQPTVLILCHEVGRKHMRGLPHQALPDLAQCIKTNLEAARLTSPDVKFGGISLNSSILDQAAALAYCEDLAVQFGVPCVDPLRHGVGAIIDRLSL